MGGLFGGGGKKAPEPQKPEKVVQKPTDMAREQAAAMQARRGQAAGARSLLSGAQDAAQANLAKKLGGGS